jgi:hypothetical protein
MEYQPVIRMKPIHIPGLFLILLSGTVFTQTFTDSNLPIVIINTDASIEIPDDPRVLASMKIIYRGPGERNYVTDQNNPAYLNYNGRIDIETRGQSSQYLSKKNYGLTTRLFDNVSNFNVSLLGMPRENDWILNGMVFDTARIRDFIGYNLSRQLGNYASRTVYCEVVINNDYRGIYLLQEQIKADDNRVDVIKITDSDNYLPEVSGGYITKADKFSPDEPIAWTMYTWYGAPVSYIHDLPKTENATIHQTNYIRSQFEDLETKAKNDDASLDDGFPSIIDVPSFIDFMIINELGSNPDAGTYSTFFHKDRNGKLRAGPVWDLDLTLGNDLFFWGYDRSKPTGWRLQDNENDGSTFWQDLFFNSEFKCYLSKRWKELIQPGHPLNYVSLEAFIDQTASTISEAVARDYRRWYIGKYHQLLIQDIKVFLMERIAWMSINLGSFSACNDVYIPPLVITRIMYNPVATVEFPVNEDLEFIEITNNGDQTVDMTGIYFSGTGLVFQFPDNATLEPHASVILASNLTTFMARYGFSPFGQFTRHLSNKHQNLVLADGFGNVIDNVYYHDDPPWPDADSTGFYLQLAGVDLDNNVAGNWTASDDVLSSGGDFLADRKLKLYPNPAVDIIRIEADAEIKSLSMFDIHGRLLETRNIESKTCELDVSRFIKGTYIIRIITTGEIYNRIIIKD